MAIMPKDPQIERLAQRASQIIASARDVARTSFGEEASKQEATVLQIASMMMSREAAELIGYELNVAKKVR